MAYAPQTWIDDDTTKPLSAARLSVMEAGIEDADNRLTTVEARIVSPVEIPYAASITPDSLAGSVFYCIATGDLTLNEPGNAIDGKHITVAIQASGGTRVVTFAGDGRVRILDGEWWVSRMIYLGTPDEWLLSEGV